MNHILDAKTGEYLWCCPERGETIRLSGEDAVSLAQAWQSLRQGHAGELRRAAHSLKSTSATFGATAVSAVAHQLEIAARDGRLEAAPDLLEQTQGELVRAKDALLALRQGG